MKILSKISIPIFLLFLVAYLLSPSTSFAQTQPKNPDQTTSYPVMNTNSDVPNTMHNWTQGVMIETMSALTCQLAGIDPINPQQGCLGIDPVTNKMGFLQNTGLPDDSASVATSAKGAALAKSGGAIGFVGNMISVLYTPPLHTGDYVKYLSSNFGITKPSYAQTTGTGFDGLQPLISIWSAFRNIVYLFLVIVFVAIGLAIMLRVKIDPRTVMSIQNQIPKIIIGILAVTFSFAIAGFLIDMMWVFIYLIYGIFNGISPDVAKSIEGLNPATMQGASPLGVQGFGEVSGITWRAGTSIVGSLSNLLGLGILDGSFMNILIHGISAGAGIFVAFFTEDFKVAGFSIPGVKGAIQGLGAAALVESGLRWAIPFVIAYLVIFIALLIALFRLWFTLIMAYVYILIDVVLAPFWIIGGIIPGSSISLSGWLRDLIANLAAFPATIAMFMLGKVFMDNFEKTPAPGTQNFVPPLIGNPGDPSLIGSLIGLGIILMTPNVVNMLKTALKAPKIETNLGKAISAGTGITGIPGKIGQIGLTLGSMQHIPGLKKLPGIRQEGSTRKATDEPEKA